MADNQFRGAEVQDCPAVRVTQNAGCPSIRVRITGGGETPEAPLSDVNFYDYDGKRVASYTAADFAALTEMPANPSHQGLTAQGWNWSLADAQAYVAAYGSLVIGQQYITDDGKTRLYINIANGARLSPVLYWRQTDANGVSINWGDGSAEETAAGTGAKSITHTYTAPGSYIITLTVTSGTAELGANSAGYSCLGTTTGIPRAYANMLQKAEIGDNMALSIGSFISCLSLKSVSLPSSLAEIPSNTFSTDYNLRCIVVPQSVTQIGGSAFASSSGLEVVAIPKGVQSIGGFSFNSCPALNSITFPDGIAAIDSYMNNGGSTLANVVIPNGCASIAGSAFSICVCLTSITIPASVTSIGNYAFSNALGMAEYHFKSTTPPTLGTGVFTSNPADCKIYVPASAVAAYQGATNWSDYASQIVGE